MGNHSINFLRGKGDDGGRKMQSRSARLGKSEISLSQIGPSFGERNLKAKESGEKKGE